ncbi:Protein white [Chionoecetes opilio]|uniref:Protein white n=1 Tax=Chionoecetes opilio TaxID=41210 RepID=A0A8J4YY24_CHIOP|nr:Protein white [Chionoecetes opilio]
MGMVCPAQYNPADYFISKLSVEPGWQDACRTHIHAVCDAFELGSGGRAMAQDVAANQRLQDHQDEDLEYSSHTSSGSPYRSSWGKQFHWVLWRSWLGTIREPRLIRIRFLQGLALSILLGFMYRRSGPYVDVYSINGSLFILIGNMTYQNMSLVVHTFCSQKELFLREHQNGMYRPDVYFISKNLVEAPVFTLYSIMYTTIFYLLAGYSLEWDRYLICVGTAVMLAWCAVSFGYFLSCVAPTLSIAVLLMAPSLILFSLLSGFYINLRSIPLIMKGFSHLSWYTYGNEILLVNQWTGVSNITCAPTAARCYPDGAAILEQLNFSEDGVVRDFASLGCLIVGYRLLAYLFFHLQTIRSKARR